MTQTRLSVNLNKVALIRNSRGRDFPSVVAFARLALEAGAAGVTIHPRPDQRHATYQDIHDLARLMRDEYPQAELNIEGNPTARLVEEVFRAQPAQFTLVPDEPDQITSDHGWDLTHRNRALEELINEFQAAGVRTSVFLDPDLHQVERAAETGTDRIELYTEDYARLFAQGDYEQVLAHYMQCVDLARELGLTVNAGHDLDLDNLGPFVRGRNLAEVSIGHALTVEALQYGWTHTIRRYIDILA